MTQRLMRVTLTLLALLLTFASSVDLRRANAEAGLCNDICGCTSGDARCCEWNGVTCYSKAAEEVGQ
jgi:hypothetical protein